MELNVFYRLDDSDVLADPVERHPFTNPHVIVNWYKEAAGDTSTSWIISVENTSVTLDPVAYSKLFVSGTDSSDTVWDIDAL